MRRSWRGLAVALAVAGGCANSDKSYVAELVEVQRTVEQQRGTRPWAAAKPGDRLALGDAVRTGASAQAELRFRRGGMLRLDPSTLVRFQRSARKAVRLDIESGVVELESSQEALEVDTSFGVAVLEGRASVRMRSDNDRLSLEVLVGSVVIEPEDDDPRTLTAGQEIAIELGGAIIEDDPPPAASLDAGSAAPAAQTITARTDGGGVSVMTDAGWKSLEQGDTRLDAGARVRVAKRARVELRRGDEHAVVDGAAEVVVGGSGDALLDTAHGKVTISATTEKVRIEVPGGVIIVRTRPGGTVARVDVDKRREDAAVTAMRGRVDIETRRGNETLRTGESAEVSRRGEVNVSLRAPAQVELAVRAGESAIVHDAKPPTALRFEFGGDCAGEGLVEVARRGSFERPAFASSGAGGANVRLARGSHRYRVRCVGAQGPDDEPIASGKITIRKDSGRRRLPRRAPQNSVDADGRKYRVLYQNLLPELTFVWPKAPRAPSYTLHLQPARGAARAKSSKKARVRLKSGRLSEGRYTWWFEAEGTRSPKTQLIIDFDNAASTGYVKGPTVSEDGAVRVEGAVIGGASVTVTGRQLPLDRHRRFSADVALPEGRDAIAIRIAHAKRGVHYYLVRVPGK